MTICVGDTVLIVSSEHFAGREAVVVRSEYTYANSSLHEPGGTFALHIEGEDYGNRTWEHFEALGRHTNFHTGSLTPYSGCLLVTLVRKGVNNRMKKGLTAFLEEYS